MSSEKIRRPSTREVELAEINASEKKWVEGFKFGAVLIKSLAGVAAIYFIMSSLETIVLSKPDSINALGNFVEKLKLGQSLGYVLAGITGVAYYRERKGKKRAIEQKGRLQKQLESKDPGRTTSGLNEQGDCPEEDQ